MDYEKKYKNALAHAREIHRNEEGKRKDMEFLFPEIKESEDEKIRKTLIRFHKSTIDIDGIKGEDIIAWLEKQGEQKPAWSEEDNMMIEETLYFLREYQQSNRCKDENGMQNSVTCEEWLKSLKDRCTWKPSSLQMECLHDAIKHYHTNGYPASKLKELYEQMSKIYKL